MWEHTKWVDVECVNQDLRPVFFEISATRIVDTPETPMDRRVDALLSRRGPFVAVVNSRGELQRIIDRSVFLDQVTERLVRESEISSPISGRTRSSNIEVDRNDRDD